MLSLLFSSYYDFFFLLFWKEVFHLQQIHQVDANSIQDVLNVWKDVKQKFQKKLIWVMDTLLSVIFMTNRISLV